MNLFVAPSVPIRTPQPGSSSKTVQLTPIWQEVIKNNRVPSGVDLDIVFREISSRLEDLEWPVRQHAFRVLCDVIPVIPKEALHETSLRLQVFPKLVANLGHPAPGVRKAASETVQKYLQYSTHKETMALDFLNLGVSGKITVEGVKTENVILGSIAALVDVLTPFFTSETTFRNGDHTVSTSVLTRASELLLEKASDPFYGSEALRTLTKLKEKIGEPSFFYVLGHLSEKHSFINLRTSFERIQKKKYENLDSENPSKTFSNDTNINIEIEKSSETEDFSDVSDSETYTKEPAPTLDDDVLYQLSNQRSSGTNHFDEFSFFESGDKEMEPRVVLEAEIRFARDKAITMTVTEDEKAFVNSEASFKDEDSKESEAEEKPRTPRRVRFGGEVVKLRTPDSDVTSPAVEGSPKQQQKKTVSLFNSDEAHITSGPRMKTVASVDLGHPRKPDERPSENSNKFSSECEFFESEAKRNELEQIPSSSGSEGDNSNKWTEDNDSFWKWTDLRLVEENIVKDLKNKENWKIQHEALEQLKVELTKGKAIEKVVKELDTKKEKTEVKLVSLSECLLRVLGASKSEQVAALALSTALRLLQIVPEDFVRAHAQVFVRGFCAHVAGHTNLHKKMEAARALDKIMRILEPSAVVDILLGESCLFSPSAKMRENSLLVIIYATTTFPSTAFQMEKILEKVSLSVADARRKVRHGALEALAVVSQFCSSKNIANALSKTASLISSSEETAKLISAVQTRLSRRVLPSTSEEGLVLYALQIPASRRFGRSGNPSGKDVDWILSGTGSLSCGSATSKTQLHAAPRLDAKLRSPVSPRKWNSQRSATALHKSSSPAVDNPWKMQKRRTEASTATPPARTPHLSESSASSVTELESCRQQLFTEPHAADSVAWALIPVSARDHQIFDGRGFWNESFPDETRARLLSSSFGPLTPLYLNVGSPCDGFLISRSSEDLSIRSLSKSDKKHNSDYSSSRLLTPTPFRKTNSSGKIYENGLNKNQVLASETRIPVFNATNKKKLSKSNKFVQSLIQRDVADPQDLANTEETTKQSEGALNESCVFLPDILSSQNQVTNESPSISVSSHGLPDLDKTKSPHNGTPNSVLGFSSDYFRTSLQSGSTNIRDDYDLGEGEAEAEEDVRSSSSSETGQPLRKEFKATANAEPADFNEASYAKAARECVSKSKKKIGKNSSKVGAEGNPFPEGPKPFERPKEALDASLVQLESQQWEANMTGLTSLVRLLRHHPALVLGHLHPLVASLARQVRNLRSQVARVACQASAEMFLLLKKNVEPDLEELAGPLFHRSADTNRFIRADCNRALDNMVDNVGHAKAVSVIVSKGTTHQNGTVRTVAARLLLRLSEKAGPQKLLSLPKETREKMLQAGANLLTEGKLETRAFAKQIIRLWSSHPSFSSLILEAVEPNVMRNISKTLYSLKC